MLGTIKRMLEKGSRPFLVPVARNIWALVFVLMKLVVARTVINLARQRGELSPGQMVVESTSGTMGLGLAYACREFDHPLTLVGDPAIDSGLCQRLEVLGANVEIVSARQNGNYQQARLDRVQEILRATNGFFTNQYHNPDCLAAYEEAGDIVTARLGHVDWLVASTGSGASGSGLATVIAQNQGQPVRFAAVDTPGSVLFKQKDGPRRFRGLGNSVVPENMRHELVDEVHWLNVGPASLAANVLHSQNLLDVGPTSGAAYLAARDLSRRYPGERVVFVAPDQGERYRQTFLSLDWLRAEGLLEKPNPKTPVPVVHPSAGIGPWSRMTWGRRTLSQIQAEFGG